MPENACIFCTMISNFIHTYFSNSKTQEQSLEWLSACNSTTCSMQIPCRFIKTSTAKVTVLDSMCLPLELLYHTSFKKVTVQWP
jgi:hypothetical protein